jgi:hypothetical protein
MQEHHVDRRVSTRRGIEAALLILIFVFLALFHEIYVDDAFITLSYARTFAESGVWGMHPQFISNAATSPLNVILLSGLIKIGFPGVWAVWVFDCILAATIFFLLKFISWRAFGSPIWSYVATLALFTNPLLVSTSGLETYLFITLLLACCVAYILERGLLLGLAAGLLVLARPDGILLTPILLTLMILEKRGAKLGWMIVSFAIVVGVWGFISWRYLGSAIPDTYFIKRKEASWYGLSYDEGLLLYFVAYPLVMGVSFAFLFFTPFGVKNIKTNRVWRTVVVLVGGLACVHYLAYSLMHLPPYHWYYGILTSAVILIGSAGLVAQQDQFSQRISYGVSALFILAGAGLSAEAALADERMPIQTNWGTVRQYREIADWMNAHVSEPEYQIIAELGVIQYYSHANAVNDFSDRKILLKFIKRLPPESVATWLARLNFAYLRPPPEIQSGYVLREDCKETQGVVKSWVTSSSWRPPVAWCVQIQK